MDTTNLPVDHLEYLQRRPFKFGCATSIFPSDEVQALSDYGNWLEALAAGALQPVNEEQEHFLKVDRDEAPPTNLYEHAWLRLKGRREYEREQNEAPLHEPPENYGIVEWDKDRCWW
jgi:uncharacterized protein YifE (UPF0438 family)